ncbi:MAG: methyltransferase domain-containing protein [Solirubrobacteraceae bacterium]
MKLRTGVRAMTRAAFESLPESARSDIRRRRAELRGLGQLKINQALLAQRLAALEHQQAPVTRASGTVDPRFPPQVRSRLCTQADLNEPWFTRWCAALGEPPLAHRKLWEWAYVGEVLDALGLLAPGHRGVGFGVGREPVISAFANRGVELLATDLAPEAREALSWVRSGQHAHGIDSMLREGVCDPARFRELVSWRPVDMRAIPADLTEFDFCWSTCSLEHLGTLDAGMDFVEQSIATLAPGGIAVHTTEFNLSSNDATVESGPTVIYRECDLMRVKDRLEASGHQVAAFDLSPGDGLLDQYVDVPPYADEPCLRFLYSSYTLTSVAIVVRARSS